uniref:Metal transporter n=1 Tax=Oryza barthii TaxID=65489 RepID=A0A0D3GPB0_9ORYZ
MEIERESSERGSISWRASAAHDQDAKKLDADDQLLMKEPAWKRFLAHVGPGFMVSLAYLDPGNLETDLQAGANHRYELLWVILIGLIFALIIQSLAANLGVVTGRHLAEICKSEYPKFVKIFLWLLAELAVIAADIPEVIGTAFAFNILFHIPVWVGVLITGTSTLLLLGLQKYGVRKLEFLISMLVFVMAACFFGELSIVKPPAKEVMKGLFIPRLNGDGATADAIALLGALVMPFFLYESGFALFVALLINIAVVSVSGTACSSGNLSQEDADKCANLSLDTSSFLLKNVLGKSSAIVYGVALLASGQSSTITGTYAGQYIMQGFLDIRMRKWLRNLMTRTIAIAPSLIVSIIGGSRGAGRLIIIASVSIFTIIIIIITIITIYYSTANCVRHTAAPAGEQPAGRPIIVFSWFLGLLIIGINMYFLSTSFVGWLIHNDLPKYANVLVGAAVFPFMLVYIVAVVYLTIRKDSVVTFVADSSLAAVVDAEKADAGDLAVDDDEPLPYRDDLADIPLPR